MVIKLVLADHHPIILSGLTQLFQTEPDMQILACCRTGKETLQTVRIQRPDVLIFDIHIPEMDGLAVLREMKKAKLPTRVVVFTAAIDEDEALEAIRLGVRGVVLKEMATQLLVQCVRKVHAGEQWLEKRSIGRALNKLLRREAAAQEITGVLTPCEIEIMQMVACGQHDKEIADGLSISEGTVKAHLNHIYEKLRVDDRVALTLYALQKGLG